LTGPAAVAALEGVDGTVVAMAGDATTAGAAVGAVPPGGAGDAFSGDADAAADADAFSGSAGPSRTPAILGQATPTMKPIAVITPTFVHEGRS
jgi:hypothetical protein